MGKQLVAMLRILAVAAVLGLTGTMAALHKEEIVNMLSIVLAADPKVHLALGGDASARPHQLRHRHRHRRRQVFVQDHVMVMSSGVATLMSIFIVAKMCWRHSHSQVRKGHHHHYNIADEPTARWHDASK